MKSKRLLFVLFAIFLTLASIRMSYITYAENVSKIQYPEVVGFELRNGNFNTGVAEYVGQFFYGKSSMGSLSIKGDFDQKTKFYDEDAYGGNGDYTIGYSYDGSFSGKNEENWHIVDDNDSEFIDGIDLVSKVKSGVVIVLESFTGEEDDWEVVAEYYDFFDRNKKGKDDLYTTWQEDTFEGLFYRVIVGYKLGRKIGTEDGGITMPLLNKPIGKKDKYEYISCVEVYNFLCLTNGQQILLRNLSDGKSITGNTSVDQGFAIRRNDSHSIVNVKYNDDVVVMEDSDFISYSEPGKYEISVTNLLGREDIYKIDVNDGTLLTALLPDIIESEQNTGFVNGKKIAKEEIIDYQFTNLYLGTDTGTTVSKSTKNGFDAYGITGSNISLYLQFRYDDADFADYYSFVDDGWGAKKGQTVYGVQPGSIGTGALIVQTSKDGKNWSNANNGRYSSGLYTTDMFNHYTCGRNILVYTPGGQDVIDGLYVRVCYLYEIVLDEPGILNSEYTDYLEKYEFYLCSNELDAVTIHNLTAASDLKQALKNEDQNTAGAYKKAETLLDESTTVTGFTIDTSLNSTVDLTVKKNGIESTIPADKTFREAGKYEIRIKSAVGSEKNLTIYVDPSSDETALRNYFGDSFINGKRIYSESEYPTFEGGLTSYHIEKIPDTLPALSGSITNITTGKAINFEQNRQEKEDTLIEAGEYIAVFTTGDNKKSHTPKSGDYRRFTFHFSIIPEGTAPGPKINKTNLESHVGLAAADCYPIYYGITFSSAAAGNITLAFANKEDAIKYAYEYEKGVVEKQEDGTYRYKGSLSISQKSSYDNTWSLTDAMNYFAEEAVQELYFDMGDEFTYRTLPEKVIKDTRNLRTLELSKSVIVFADEAQRNKLCERISIPLINDKVYAQLEPGENGKLTTGKNAFEFIKDKYGCDSNNIYVTDQSGKTYKLEYKESVEKQLSEQNCPSGIITIMEESIYGDKTSYKALFIADGDNKAKVNISYKDNGEDNNRTFSVFDKDTTVEMNNAAITQIRDDLDPHSLMIVEHNGTSSLFAANEEIQYALSEKGAYKITLVNHKGNKYSFTINVK